MTRIREGELDRVREEFEGFYRDLLLHRPYTPVESDLGEEQVEAWVDGDQLQCSFFPEVSTERTDGQERTVTIDSMIRLPLRLLGVLKSSDHIVLLKRGRMDVTPPLTFRVVGEADVYKASIMFDLQRVTL